MGTCMGVRKTPGYESAPKSAEAALRAAAASNTPHKDSPGEELNLGSGNVPPGSPKHTSRETHIEVAVVEIGGIPRKHKTLEKLSAKSGYFCDCWYENGTEKHHIYRTITREFEETDSTTSIVFSPGSKIEKFGESTIKIPRKETANDTQVPPLVRFQVYASYFETSYSEGMSRLVGETVISVSELERKDSWQLWMFDPLTECIVFDRSRNVVPMFISIRVPTGVHRSLVSQADKRCVIITRGTRGDVQPFVALARGLAEQRNWDVTIVTEMRYRDLVLKNSIVKRGGIHFRPSGGDTEARIDRPMARWFIMQENSTFQLLMLARAEREFFESEPAFSFFVEQAKPDYLLFGFNTANIALILSEAYRLPICGFILQPTIIPSTQYPAIVPIGSAEATERTLTPSNLLEMGRRRRTSITGYITGRRSSAGNAEEASSSSLPSSPVKDPTLNKHPETADESTDPTRTTSPQKSPTSSGTTSPLPVQDDATAYISSVMDTSHSVISMLKPLMENNMFTSRINAMRQTHGLPKQKGDDLDFKILQNLNVPMICPINEKCFGGRPKDWKACVDFSDFIFLSPANDNPDEDPLLKLAPKLQKFIRDAKEANAPIVAIGFSSMPVSRTAILGLSSLVAERSDRGARVIALVGVRPSNEVTDQVEESRANSLKESGKLLEIGGAPYGLLFPLCDFLVVHGGLGTTSEAFRAGKPCLVTGVLLFDQRFWGRRVYELGCGPKPVHVNNLRREIVNIVDKGLKPGNPWAANAKKIAASLKEAGNGDGIKLNVDKLAEACDGAAKSFAMLPKWQSSRTILITDDAPPVTEGADTEESVSSPATTSRPETPSANDPVVLRPNLDVGTDSSPSPVKAD